MKQTLILKGLTSTTSLKIITTFIPYLSSKGKKGNSCPFLPPFNPPTGGMDPAKNCNKLQFSVGSSFHTYNNKPTLFFFLQFLRNQVINNQTQGSLTTPCPKVVKAR